MDDKQCRYCGVNFKNSSDYITCRDCGHKGCTTAYTEQGRTFNRGCGAICGADEGGDKCVKCKSYSIIYK